MENRLEHGEFLMNVYSRLHRRWGPQGWWPAESRLEIIVGAILTQAVSWSNVEMAIANLKGESALSVEALDGLPHDQLAALIRPAGYYNAKARKLKSFISFIKRDCGGTLDPLFEGPVPEARGRLLGVYGIGPETADSILLYAGGLSTFVIDAYTRRIIGRLEEVPDPRYEKLRKVFLQNLPRSVELYGEYHALLVRLGRACCHRTAARTHCRSCPLRRLCRSASRQS